MISGCFKAVRAEIGLSKSSSTDAETGAALLNYFDSSARLYFLIESSCSIS
jgi:hypothetical protein